MQKEKVLVRSIDEIIPMGVTMPLGGTLLDGTEVIIKYPNNPFGNQVLVNELIGACIGDIIGVLIPEYGLCYLGEDVICTSEYYGSFGEGLDEKNAGLSFYTKRYTNTTIVQDYAKGHIQTDAFLIVLYDYILNNCDRHKGNLLQLIGSDQCMCIDNSHIVIDKGDSLNNIRNYLTEERIESIQFLLQDKEFYKGFLQGAELQKLEEYAALIQNDITKSFFDDINSLIPREWVKAIGENTIEMLWKVIMARVNALDNICKRIWEVCHE